MRLAAMRLLDSNEVSSCEFTIVTMYLHLQDSNGKNGGPGRSVRDHAVLAIIEEREPVVESLRTARDIRLNSDHADLQGAIQVSFSSFDFVDFGSFVIYSSAHPMENFQEHTML